MQTDVSGIEAGLVRLHQAILAGIRAGTEEAADMIQTVDRDTDAYYGMSGATRASSTAYPMDDRAESRIATGYAAAVSRLTNYRGHEGKPLRTNSGVILGVDEQGILLTSFTDYADALEFEKAGQKAHLGPTIQATARHTTQLIAGFIKTELS